MASVHDERKKGEEIEENKNACDVYLSFWRVCNKSVHDPDFRVNNNNKRSAQFTLHQTQFVDEVEERQETKHCFFFREMNCSLFFLSSILEARQRLCTAPESKKQKQEKEREPFRM